MERSSSVSSFMSKVSISSQRSPQNKRRQFTLKEKIDVLDNLKRGGDATMIAKQFGCDRSTISNIKKNELISREQIIASKNLNAKKLRKSEFPQLEEALIQWFSQMREKNGIISGPLLLEKASQFAQTFGYDNFSASSGWLEHFNARNNIGFCNPLSANHKISDKKTFTFFPRHAFLSF